MLKWDGDYLHELSEPLWAEHFIFELSHLLLPLKFKQQRSRVILQNSIPLKDILRDILDTLPQTAISLYVHEALEKAKSKSARSTWGDFHRIQIAHVLAKVPLFGRRLIYRELAADGSRNSLHKQSFIMGKKKGLVGFGANARHISNMADINENYFVLFGSQEGYLKYSEQTDQTRLWQRGDYIKMPLDLKEVAQRFKSCDKIKALKKAL